MIRELHLWNSTICFVLGLTLNMLLIWLVLRRSPKEMRSYSRILLQTCFTDLSVCILMELVQPILLVHNGALLIYMNNPWLNHHLSTPLRFAMLELWIYTYDFAVFGLSVEFAYRYLLLVRHMTIYLCRYCMMLAVPFLVQLVNCLLFYLSCFPRNEDIILNAQIAQLLSMDAIEPIPLAVNADTTAAWFLTTIFFVIIANLFFFSVVAFCGYRIVKFVRDNMKAQSAEQKRILDLNRQLTRNMIALGVLPLLLMLTNIGITVSVLFPSDYGGIAMVTVQMLNFAPLHWLPVLNPLVSILTIRLFRRAICRWILKKFVKNHGHMPGPNQKTTVAGALSTRRPPSPVERVPPMRSTIRLQEL